MLAVYAWSLMSMLRTLAGTTLLSFRLQPTLTVLLTAAGTFGFIEATLAVARRYGPDTGRRIVVAAGAVGAIGAMTFAQDIPDVLRSDIVVAYTDTDGNGQRADRRPPGAEKYYREIDAKIQEATGRPRNETVVLTADYSFLSYYPYYGFQGLTSHYANPLAEFNERAAAIEHWSTLERADQFIADLDKLPWTAPTVFLMRRGGAGDSADNYTLRLASDVYPNQPNVRRYQVTLDAALFDDPSFSVSDVGPFVLAIRQPGGRLMAVETPPQPGQLPSSPVVHDRAMGTNHRTARLVAIIAGLLGAVLALATPFLPVKQTTAALNWPQNGVLQSVNAPLIGYVATDLTISVPCSAAAGLAGPENAGKTVLLSTVPKQAPKAVDRGLLIERVNNDVLIIVRNTPVVTAPLNQVLSPACQKITFTAHADKVTADFVGLVHGPGSDNAGKPLRGERSGYDFRPQIVGVFTDLAGPAPPGHAASRRPWIRATAPLRRC